MATKESSKNSLYFVFTRVYLKSELGDHHFLLLESDKNARIKRSAMFKKFLCSRLIATLTSEKF